MFAALTSPQRNDQIPQRNDHAGARGGGRKKGPQGRKGSVTPLRRVNIKP
jgi:hypothetical protein